MMFAAAIEADTTLSTKSPEARALAAKLMQKYDRDRNGKVSRPPSSRPALAGPCRGAFPPPRTAFTRRTHSLNSHAPFPRSIPAPSPHVPCPRHPMPTPPHAHATLTRVTLAPAAHR